MPGDSCTMFFLEFSLKDGLTIRTGQAANKIYGEDSITCKQLHRIHFDDENGLVRLLETHTDTATVYTWEMDNLVLQSKLDIVDQLPTNERNCLCPVISPDYVPVST